MDKQEDGRTSAGYLPWTEPSKNHSRPGLSLRLRAPDGNRRVHSETLVLFIFLLGVVEKKKWLFTVFVGIAVTVVAYLVFEVWLQSQLPKGLLGFLREFPKKVR